MALIYYYGDVPVQKEEVEEKFAIGNLQQFSSKSITLNKNLSFEFREGTVKTKDLWNNQPLVIPDYTPIGINKPLSVEILCAYSGDAPRKFLGRKKDIMTVSAVKGYNTFDAAPKAINHIKKKVEDNTHIRIGAGDDGSPVIYYTKALDVSSLLLSYELVADTFSDETIKTIGSLFASAAGLPIFAPAAPFLLAGSVISGLIGNIGKSLLESKAFMREDETLSFGRAGIETSVAKQVVVCNESDINDLNGYKPGSIKVGDKNKPSLVSKKNGKAYSGNAPYLLLNRDGKEKPELESFSPKLASAAVLEKYYGAKDRGAATSEILQTAMTFYNDYSYQEKARKLSKEIDGMKVGSDAHNRASELLEAYKKNIQTDQFKVK